MKNATAKPKAPTTTKEAPENLCRVLHLFNAPEDEPGFLVRRPVERMDLVAGGGIVGHKRFGKTRTRQINVLQARLYSWFEASFSRKLEPGATGENIVVDDAIDLNWFPLGSRFRLGSATVELRTWRSPCRPMAKNNGVSDSDYFVGHVGVFFEVVESGSVAVGDFLDPLP